jgi:hypothetical protein
MNSKLAQSLAGTRWCFGVVALAALTACGGGGGGDTPAAPANSGGNGSTAPSPASAPTPPAPAVPPVTSELSDTSDVVSPLSVVADTLPHSSSAGAELIDGLFKFGRVTIIGGATDCPAGGAVSCLYFVRYKQSSTGVMAVDSWAYQPNAKIWTPLSTDFTDEWTLPYANNFNAGDGSWTSSYDITSQSASNASGQWQYTRGQVAHQLNVSETSITGTAMSNVQTAGNYPAGAKRLDMTLEQVSGRLTALDSPSTSFTWPSYDKATYSTLASYRAAHASNNRPYCLYDVWLSGASGTRGLVFDPIAAAGSLVSLAPNETCSSAIVAGSEQQMRQSVVTAGGRKVMLFQAPAAALPGSTARDKQRLLAVALDIDGRAASGFAYTSGFTLYKTNLYNKSALIAWLQANTSDTQVQTLP